MKSIALTLFWIGEVNSPLSQKNQVKQKNWTDFSIYKIYFYTFSENFKSVGPLARTSSGGSLGTRLQVLLILLLWKTKKKTLLLLFKEKCRLHIFTVGTYTILKGLYKISYAYGYVMSNDNFRNFCSFIII